MELDLAEIRQLAAEQGIDAETLDQALCEALLLAYQKMPHSSPHARVELDDRAGTFTVWARDEVPAEPGAAGQAGHRTDAEGAPDAERPEEDAVGQPAARPVDQVEDLKSVPAEPQGESEAEGPQGPAGITAEAGVRAASGRGTSEDGTPGAPGRDGSEEDDRPRMVLGEEYDDTPKDFGRMAASTARQVIRQLFQEAEDERIFGAFSGQKGKLITGVVQQDADDPSNVHVAVGDVEAILPKREQVPGERYRHGERLRVYVVNVSRGLRGPEIVVSRSHPELVRRLFEREVPELVSGAVSIMSIAREAGARTKIAVRANTKGVNPKGALIGPAGARVRAVMENLGPEKIDIVDWSAEPADFVAAALSPAVVKEVQIVSKTNRTAIAFIKDAQLSLAIGKEGQNARLAAKLTGWNIGIESAETHEQELRRQAAAQASPQGEEG